MNAARLLQHFERISEVPDAIPRLRRFILDLAVRGKLVEQDPNDEPAAELLKQIQKHKVEFAKSVRGERSSAIRALNHDDVSFMIPGRWVWVSFGSIMISRDSERIPVSKEERAGRAKIYDYYGASGIIDKINDYLFDKPLLLIGEDGANLINRSTPIAFIARGRYWVNNHAHVLDGISEGFLRFIELHINAIDLKPYVTGTAQPKMNQAKMNTIPIALPPLAEQHRIVARVDELMALCDQLEAAKTEREQSRDRLVSASLHRLNSPADTAETDAPDLSARQADACRDHARFVFNHLPRLTTRPEHIKQLRQTILNLAVRGKLVSQDSNDEPAEELLKRLAQSKQQKGMQSRKGAKLQQLNDENGEMPFQIPSNWLWLRIGALFEVAGGIQKTPLRAPKSNAFPYLGVGNVYRGRIDLTTVKEFELQDGELERWHLEAGDLLIIEGNGSLSEIGQCAIWNGEIESCVHQNHVIRCRPLDLQISPFVLQFLNSPAGTAIMQRLAITTSGLYSLSVGKIRQIEVPLPPLAEQHRIVARVDELMALCDELEAQLTATEADSRRLLEAVLHEALAPALEGTV